MYFYFSGVLTICLLENNLYDNRSIKVRKKLRIHEYKWRVESAKSTIIFSSFCFFSENNDATVTARFNCCPSFMQHPIVHLLYSLYLQRPITIQRCLSWNIPNNLFRDVSVDATFQLFSARSTIENQQSREFHSRINIARTIIRSMVLSSFFLFRKINDRKSTIL